MTVQEVQSKTTSGEFMEWCAYMEMAGTEPTPDHYYLAQIAAVIRQNKAKNPRSVRISQFLLEFKPATRSKKTKKSTPANSKAFWMGSLGMKAD